MSNLFISTALALALALPLGAATVRSPRAPQRPVNLNTATVTELMQLPRIGQKTAERILAFRKQHGGFQRPEALMNVKGIGEKSYAIGQLLADLRSGIFTELSGAAPKVDPYRRNLQRAYLELLGNLLNQPALPSMAAGGLGMTVLMVNTSDDCRGAVRAELKTLQAHLEDLKDQITRVLDPKFQAAQPSAASATPSRRVEETCWPSAASLEN